MVEDEGGKRGVIKLGGGGIEGHNNLDLYLHWLDFRFPPLYLKK